MFLKTWYWPLSICIIVFVVSEINSSRTSRFGHSRPNKAAQAKKTSDKRPRHHSRSYPSEAIETKNETLKLPSTYTRRAHGHGSHNFKRNNTAKTQKKSVHNRGTHHRRSNKPVYDNGSPEDFSDQIQSHLLLPISEDQIEKFNEDYEHHKTIRHRHHHKQNHESEEDLILVRKNPDGNTTTNQTIQKNNKNYKPPALVPFLIKDIVLEAPENYTLVIEALRKYANETDVVSIGSAAKVHAYLLKKLQPKLSEMVKNNSTMEVNSESPKVVPLVIKELVNIGNSILYGNSFLLFVVSFLSLKLFNLVYLK